MITSPTIDDMLEGVIVAIETDILPNLDDQTAQASAQMMQSLLQGVRQLLPTYESSLVDEHNAMNAALLKAAAALAQVQGSEANRIRERASLLGAADDLPAPADVEQTRLAHRSRAEAIRDCLYDLDVMQRAGVQAADESLDILRAMLTPQYLHYMGTFPMQGGMLGRG